MEVWKIIFLSKWVICRFQPLIFQGVTIINQTDHSIRINTSRGQNHVSFSWAVSTTYRAMVTLLHFYIGVSPKIWGTPKWMVKIMENPVKMDDLGGTTIFGNIHIDTTFIWWKISMAKHRTGRMNSECFSRDSRMAHPVKCINWIPHRIHVLSYLATLTIKINEIW